MPDTDALAAQAKANADEIKDAEATRKGARGGDDNDPPEGGPDDMPPPHPH